MLQADGVHPSWTLWPQQSSQHCYHRCVCNFHRHQSRWLASIGLHTLRCWWAGLGVLWAEDVQDRLSCIGERVLWMAHPSLLPVRDPANLRLQFYPEHQAVVYLCPVIQGILPPAGGEILRASARCILHQHLVLPCFLGVQSTINPLPYLTGLGDVSGENNMNIKSVSLEE